MEHIIAAQTDEDFLRYRRISQDSQPVLENFLSFLKSEYSVNDLPNCVIWTSFEIATKSISNIPLPGYTNSFRTVFCPDLAVWQEIYLHQLDDEENQDVRRFYETQLTRQHILQILGHEFVHHSDLFLDEAYETSRWFEEGMCEYISRKFFLSEDQFRETVRINRILVKQFQTQNVQNPLEKFTAATYSGNYNGIFYEYWRSFLAVNQIAERYHGDIGKVFASYHQWYRSGSRQSLSDWLQIAI